jgi:hypothetical protein
MRRWVDGDSNPASTWSPRSLGFHAYASPEERADPLVLSKVFHGSSVSLRTM